MSKIKDGGPAFPVAPDDLVGSKGMTLRDWFAGQALAGMLANEQLYLQVSMMDLPVRAYTIADAMLAARSKEAS